MKEFEHLKESALKLTSDYGTIGDKQKRNLWNAIDNLEIRLNSHKEFLDMISNLIWNDISKQELIEIIQEYKDELL